MAKETLTIKRKLRCAVYTRKSSEEGLEQEFNSLDAQREACEAYVASQRAEGWLLLGDRYDDGGFSGGTLERPGLKRLVSDIEARKVDIVVVYKIDRLSRSLMDFARLVEVFDRNGVTFVSVTQSFNTTTSMGRLTLNILLSFAQFERKVIGERIRDKFAASRKKGMWMGGYVPMGYAVKDRKLVIVEAEATLVRSIFDAVSGPLLLSIERLARARAFAQWRAAHVADVGELTKAILQGPGGDADAITDLTPIGRKLEALASIVKGVAPLNAALELCQRMATQLKTRRAKEEHLKLYRRAVTALESIIELGSLAEKQVDGLRKLLHTRASYWRDRCYHNSYPMAGHALRDTAMDVKGVLDIRVGFEKASAPAQHISNASALRASLMGFFLAFWEHVLAERGGIALLILDDPQELLDHDNKEKLARLLPELAKQDGQLLVATYDRHFARAAVAAGREHATIEHRSVHPVNPSRDTLKTASAVEELDRKRNAYEQDKDSASLAQDYANEVRIFLEARLADLFDDPAYPAYAAISKAPTLADHLGRLRSLVKSLPNALFKGKAVTDFCDCKALAHGAECMKVLNTAHHNKSSLSAGDVYAVAGNLDFVRKLAEKMHIEFRHWRWHEPLQAAEAPTNVVPFKSVTAPAFKVLIHPDLAAFTATSAHEATQDEASEMFDASWFADKTLFLIRKNNLGFSVPDGCIAITESNSYDGKDHNLVIARKQGHLLARRLFRPPHGDELALAAEAPDPRESKPTLLFNAGDVVLHRIVGMLTEQPAPPASKGEATELTSAVSLSHIKTAYRVREESGIPLALPGQIVLGGDIVTKNELTAMEGTLIALGLDDGSSVFKRIGKRVPGTAGRLWQFESVGGLGSSMVVSLVEPDEKSDAPRFACARRIIGVLYTV